MKHDFIKLNFLSAKIFNVIHYIMQNAYYFKIIFLNIYKIDVFHERCLMGQMKDVPLNVNQSHHRIYTETRRNSHIFCHY